MLLDLAALVLPGLFFASVCQVLASPPQRTPADVLSDLRALQGQPSVMVTDRSR